MQELCKKFLYTIKKPLLVFFLILLIISLVIANEEYIDSITYAMGDLRWCQLTGCTIIDLKVKNLTIENGTVNFINKTVINLTVIGQIDIEGNINAENGTFNELNVSRIKVTNLQVTDLINSSQSLDSSLVLDLKLNGNVNDSSQYENHGTNNGAILSRDVGEFNGDDFVEVAHDGSLSITDKITISGWIKRDVIGVTQTILTKRSGATINYQLSIVSNKLRFAGNDGAVYTIDSTGTITDTNLHHIAFSFDTISNDFTFYIDGINAGSGTDTNNFLTNAVVLSVGKDTVGNFWNGSIACVKIYNRALSLGEITEEMSQCDAVTNYEHFNNIEVGNTNTSTLTVKEESNFLGDVHMIDSIKYYFGSADDFSCNFNGSDYICLGEVGSPRVIFDSIGNFGIGTDNPVNKLDIEGAVAIGVTYSGTSTAPANGLIVEGDVGLGVSNPERSLQVRDTDGTPPLVLNTPSGAVGGLTGLEFEYATDHRNIARIMGETEGGGGGSILFQTAAASADPYLTKMTLKKSGNVGIGTTTPNEKLTVVGNENLTGNQTLGDKITFRLGEMIDNIQQGWLRVTKNLNITGKTISNETIFRPSPTFIISASDSIPSDNTMTMIRSSGGAVDLTSNPQIAAGDDGEFMIIMGMNDTDTVTLETGNGLHLHSGKLIVGRKDHILFHYDAMTNEWHELTNNFATSEKTWGFDSPSGSSGTFYFGGFYKFASSDNDFSPSTTFGTADSAYAAHFFVVMGDETVDVLTINVTGTSIWDNGTRTTNDNESILIPSSTAVNSYFETEKKWLGQVTINAVSGTPKTANYGFAKYWDNNNNNFRVLGLEATWLGGANDVSPDIKLLHHMATGWTFNSGSAPSPPAAVASMASDYSTEDNVKNNEEGAWKRDNLNEAIEGSGSEGMIIEIVTTANKAFEQGNFLLRIRPD